MSQENDSHLLSRRFILRSAVIGAAALVSFEGDRILPHAQNLLTAIEYLPHAIPNEQAFQRFLEEKRVEPSFYPIKPYSILFGISPEHTWLETREEREMLYGRLPQISNYFLYGYKEGDKKFDATVFDQMNEAYKLGVLPMISWGEYNDGFGTDSDENLENMGKLAELLGSLPYPVVFRPYYEMNGSWAPGWYGIKSAEHYVAGWRKMREIFWRKGAHNVFFCFSPNARTGPDIIPFAPFFPGDRYIDISSIDVYNNPRIYLPPRIAVGNDIAILQSLTGKPYGISECGTSHNSQPGKWMEEIMKYTTWCRCSFFMVYDRDEREKKGDGVDWRVASNPELKVIVPQVLRSYEYSLHSPEPPVNAWHKVQLLQAA